MSDITRVAKFMMLGGQTVPATPDWFISPEDIEQFLDRVDEEIAETYEAGVIVEDVERTAEIVDGFLDVAYAAMTGAIRVAGAAKANEAWEAIIQANLSKVDGSLGEVVRDPETGKIQKPEGWTAPDIEGILNG